MFLGTDPEFFILDKNGKPVPAHLRGVPDKTKKRFVRGGSVFRDGYAVELNIIPTGCRETLALNVKTALQDARKSFLKGGDRFSTIPTVPIDLADIRKGPPDVREFGCEPSFDAYDLQVKSPLADALTYPWRSIGGHMHFSVNKLDIKPGYDKELAWMLKPANYPTAVRLLDLFLGIPLTCLHHRPAQYARRRLYGQAGEFRPQTYNENSTGFEYRTPGPEIWNHHAISGMAFGVARWVLKNFNVLRPTLDLFDPDRVRVAINTGKGRFALLQTVNSFYTPALIKYLALHKRPTLFSLALPNETGFMSIAWPEHVRNIWKLPTLRPTQTVVFGNVLSV